MAKLFPKNNIVSPAVVATPVSADQFAGPVLSWPVVARVVVDLQHNLHRSTAHTKTRGEVAGSTKKPWRQKGTGRARVGTKRTPLWRGGGRVFGPRSIRNFHHQINHQLLSPALRTALADKAAAGEVLALEQGYTGSAKTQASLHFLKGVLDPQSNLLVIAQAEPKLTQAVRNLPYLRVRQASQINLLDILEVRRVILLPDALTILVDKLKS